MNKKLLIGIIIAVLVIVSIFVYASLAPRGKLVRIDNIVCDGLPNELMSQIMEITWLDRDEHCIMCHACGCSCSVEDKLVSGEFSITVTYISCYDNGYTLNYRYNTYLCHNLTINEI